MNADAGAIHHANENMVGIDRGMRDGVLVHAAALAAGFSTRLLPRQVLQVWTPGGETTSFTHGIPQSTTLAAVTYSQDLRMRRGLLGHYGISQPRGATFEVGRARGAAARYAQKVGYPVVIKPAIGDSTTSVQSNVGNATELDEAFDELLTPLRERPGHTEAAYGITELRKPGRRKGKETVPPGYRILVEEQVSGRYLRVLVLHGEILSFIDCPAGPWGIGNSSVEELGDLTQPVGEIVREVTGALPGLKVVSVDLVIPEESAAGNSGSANALVVDVSERPWLEVQRRIDPQLATGLARRILGADLDPSTIPSPKSRVKTHATFEGVIAPTAFLETLTNYAGSVPLDVNLEVTDSALGHVGGTLGGEPLQMAETVEILLHGGIESQVAMKAKLEQ